MWALVVCERCHRHVKHFELACPFCGRALSGAPDRRGLALAAWLATAGLAFGACSGQSQSLYGGPPYDGGGTAGHDASSGGAAGTASVACAVCANPWFVCTSPGAESVNFQVEAQTATGCAGHIVQFSGPTTPFTIRCAPSELCVDVQCYPATLTSSSFSWSNAKCTATAK